MTEAEAAVAIVHTRGPGESVLLMRRTERVGDPWSGHWSFPGGRCEAEDRDLLGTALRELSEECGIRLSREQVERALEPAMARRREGRFLRVAPFLFLTDEELPTVLDEREAVESRWVPLRTLADPAQHRLRPVPGMPPEMLFPSFGLGPVPLWGFTYRMITDWLALVPEPRPGTVPPAAGNLLEWLVSHGVAIKQGWTNREAVVSGLIPTAAVFEYLAQPNGAIPQINRVEVRAESIRVTGLAFEEYLIRATGTPR